MSDLHLDWSMYYMSYGFCAEAETSMSGTIYVSGATDIEVATKLSAATVALTSSSDVTWDYTLHRNFGGPYSS